MQTKLKNPWTRTKLFGT